MDRLDMLPLVRGAYLAAGKAPVVIRHDGLEAAGLPVAADLPEEPADIGNSLRDLLEDHRRHQGGLPPGVTVPGIGSFFAGKDYDAAEKNRQDHTGGTAPDRTAGPDAYRPLPAAGRQDVVRGRIALVTGGAQGFGAEIARHLADAGAFVYIADINADGAAAFAAELNAGGRTRSAAVAVDVSDEDSVRDMARTVAATTGGLDLFVSNAGVLRAGSVLTQEKKDFDFVTQINYSAFFLGVKHMAALMVAQRVAAPDWTTDIVQINSKSGLTGSNKNGAYAGGKFGGIGLVQSFALELVEHGIKVNAVCPGNFFDGPLWSDPEKGLFVQYLRAGKVPGAESVADVKRFYEEKVPMKRGCGGDDVARAILYCVEQQYETGQAVPVTGGQNMLH